MGRRNQEWSKKEQSYGGWQKQHSYGWQQQELRQHGGYRQRETWQHGQGWEEDKPQLPSYAMMKVDQAPTKDTGKPDQEDLPIRPGEFVRGIQRFVTVARKPEIRVRKAQEEREAILGRWHKFQTELQAAFVKERELFKKDLQRNQDEMDKLDEAQRGAFEDLQKAFSSPATLKAKATTQPNEEAIQEWQKLLEGCEEEPDVDMTVAMAETLGAHLREYLAAKTPDRRKKAKEETVTPPRPEQGRPGAGSSKAWDAFMEMAGGFARRSTVPDVDTGEGIPTDPYMTSPSRNTLMPEPETRTPSRTRPKSQRTPVKLLGRRPAPSPKPGSALAKRLEAKRRTAQSSFKIHGGEISDEEEDEVMVGALARQEGVPEEIVE